MNQYAVDNCPIFKVFKESGGEPVSIDDFKELGFDVDSENFKSRMSALGDNALIQRIDGKSGVGLRLSGADGCNGFGFWIPSIRLQLSTRCRYI